MKTKIRLKTEETLATSRNVFESFLVVAAKALGGKKSGSAPPPKADPATAPKTADELEARLSRALSGH